MGTLDVMTEWWFNDSKLVINQKNTVRYSNTTSSVSQNEHKRPDQTQLQTSINKIETYFFAITTGMMNHWLSIMQIKRAGQISVD